MSLTVAIHRQPSFPIPVNAREAVDEGARDEFKRVGAPIRDTAKPDDHLGILGTHASRIAPYLTQIGCKVLRA